MSNVYLKKYDVSNIFNLTKDCLPQQLNTIHKYSLKFTPTYKNKHYFKHFIYSKKSFISQLSRTAITSTESNIIQAITNFIIIKYCNYIKNNNKYKYKRNKTIANFDKKEWNDIHFIGNHDKYRLVPSDKNMGPVWLPHNIINENTTLILQNKENFQIENKSEMEIIKICGQKVLALLEDDTYNKYINKKQRAGMKNQVCNCKKIPLMLPLIKIHKTPIKWRPVCRMSKSWVSYDLQKMFTIFIKQLVIDSKSLVRNAMKKARKQQK